MATTAKKKVVARRAIADKPAVARRATKASPTTGSTRVRVVIEDDGGEELAHGGGVASDYFAKVDKEGVDFISSGCVGLDAALGGGWPSGRVVNIVGDRSAGKTLLAIEACANFHRKFPVCHIRYAEAEAAFDVLYAEALGMPVDAVEYDSGRPLRTIEDWQKDLTEVLKANKGKPILYVLDSLDALSDEAEAERDIDKASFGASKAKKMGELFRRMVAEIEDANCTLIVISQLRDKIGVTFGEKQTRSGGRALDFYATHIVWLSEIGKIKKTIDKVERVVGTNVKARIKKNKVGLPFREFAYPIIFGYGIDDLTSSVEWLLEVGCDDRLKEVGMSAAGYKVRIGNLRNKGGAEVKDIREKLNVIVRDEWQRIEMKFLPRSRKY
jgi:recombination protein RecA